MAETINKPAGFPTEKPDHIMLSVNGDATKQMAVTWRTDITVSCGFIEYREENTDNVVRKGAENLVFKYIFCLQLRLFQCKKYQPRKDSTR